VVNTWSVTAVEMSRTLSDMSKVLALYDLAVLRK
jgi:hypothetical protein